VELRWFDEGAVVALDDVLASLPEVHDSAAGAGGVDPRGDPLLAISPGIYVPVLVGSPLNRDRKVSAALKAYAARNSSPAAPIRYGFAWDSGQPECKK
jgi:hypothetical protein